MKYVKICINTGLGVSDTRWKRRYILKSRKIHFEIQTDKF